MIWATSAPGKFHAGARPLAIFCEAASPPDDFLRAACEAGRFFGHPTVSNFTKTQENPVPLWCCFSENTRNKHLQCCLCKQASQFGCTIPATLLMAAHNRKPCKKSVAPFSLRGQGWLFKAAMARRSAPTGSTPQIFRVLPHLVCSRIPCCCSLNRRCPELLGELFDVRKFNSGICGCVSMPQQMNGCYIPTTTHTAALTRSHKPYRHSHLISS